MSYGLVQIRKATATGDLIYQLMKYGKYAAVEAMIGAGDSINSNSMGGSPIDSIIGESIHYKSIRAAGWRIPAIQWLIRHGAIIGSHTKSKLLNAEYNLSVDVMIILDEAGSDFVGTIDNRLVPNIISAITSGKIDVNMYSRHIDNNSAEWIEISEHIGIGEDSI